MSNRLTHRSALLAALTEVVAEGRVKTAGPIDELQAKTYADMTRVEKGLGHTVGRAAAAPFRAVGNAFGGMLLGPKQQFGPHRGKRIQEIPGGPGKGLKEITPAEYREIRTGKKKGKAYAGVIGNKPVHYKQRYGPGGLVGLVRAHPGKALGAAGIAYLLGTSKAARDAAAMLSPDVSGFKNQASPDVLRELQHQPSGKNPLGSSVWG